MNSSCHTNIHYLPVKSVRRRNTSPYLVVMKLLLLWWHNMLLPIWERSSSKLGEPGFMYLLKPISFLLSPKALLFSHLQPSRKSHRLPCNPSRENMMRSPSWWQDTALTCCESFHAMPQAWEITRSSEQGRHHLVFMTYYDNFKQRPTLKNASLLLSYFERKELFKVCFQKIFQLCMC